MEERQQLILSGASPFGDDRKMRLTIHYGKNGPHIVPGKDQK